MMKIAINSLYVCKKCRSAFLFETDMEDHARLTGHGEFATCSLEDVPGK